MKRTSREYSHQYHIVAVVSKSSRVCSQSYAVCLQLTWNCICGYLRPPAALEGPGSESSDRTLNGPSASVPEHQHHQPLDVTDFAPFHVDIESTIYTGAKQPWLNHLLRLYYRQESGRCPSCSAPNPYSTSVTTRGWLKNPIHLKLLAHHSLHGRCLLYSRAPDQPFRSLTQAQ
jgi:hypothetical protein